MIPKPKAFCIHKDKQYEFTKGLGFDCRCINNYVCYVRYENGDEMRMCEGGYEINSELLDEVKANAAMYEKQKESND